MVSKCSAKQKTGDKSLLFKYIYCEMDQDVSKMDQARTENRHAAILYALHLLHNTYLRTYIRSMYNSKGFLCKCLPYYSIYANGILKQLPRFICMHKHIQLKIYQKTTSRATPPLWRDLVNILTRKPRHASSLSLECTDFKNVIFEKIP